MARYELFLTRLPELEPQWLQATLASFPPQLNRDMLTRALHSRRVPKAAIAWADEPEPIYQIHAQLIELGAEAYVYEQSTWWQRRLEPMARTLRSRRSAAVLEAGAGGEPPPKLASFEVLSATSTRIRRSLYVIGFAMAVVMAGLVLQRWDEAHTELSSGLAGLSKLHAASSHAATQRAGKREPSPASGAPSRDNARTTSNRSAAESRAATEAANKTPIRATGPHPSAGWEAVSAVARGLGSELVEAKWLFFALALGMLAARSFAFGLRWSFVDGAARFWARGVALLSCASAGAALVLLDLPEAAPQAQVPAPRPALASRAPQPPGKPFAGLIAELRHRHAERLAQSRATATVQMPTQDGSSERSMRAARTAPATHAASEPAPAATRTTAAEDAAAGASARTATSSAPTTAPHERARGAAALRALVREVGSRMAGPAPTPVEDIVPGDWDALSVLRASIVAPPPVPEIRAPTPPRIARVTPSIDAASLRSQRLMHGVRIVGLAMLFGLAGVFLLVWERRRAARARRVPPRAAATEITAAEALCCPQCGTRYPLEATFCGNDGQPLRPAS